MAKGFKLKLSLPSIRFCRSKKLSSIPRSPSKLPVPMRSPSKLPVPMRTQFSPKVFTFTHPKLPTPPSTPNHPLLKIKVIALMSGCVSKLSKVYVNSLKVTSTGLPRLCNSPVLEDHDRIPCPVSISTVEGGRISTDQDHDDNEESEGLMSSCSSFDSSLDFGYALKTIKEARAYGSRRHSKTYNARKDGERTTIMATLQENEGLPSPGKKTVFDQLMPCMVDGKVNESYAVMKKSDDPYDDFKKSMMEMILEKQLSESKDLEDLLMCLLSLNSKDHHDVIMEAFGEVWGELFASKS